MKAPKAYMVWLLVSASPLPHLWPVFLLLPKLQPHWPCCCEYTKVIPALGPFIVSHTWNIHSSLVGSSFVSQGPAQVLPPHRGIYSTAVQCLQRSKPYFPCPLLLGFQVVIQVRPSDTPHECVRWAWALRRQSLLVVMLLFLLDFHVPMASVADVQLSVACVHIPQ